MAERKTCRYRLTLEVEDGGCRRFEATYESERQDKLSKVAWDIARALQATMECPPSVMELVQAIETDYTKLAGLAYAYSEMWTATSNFEDCFRVIVDASKMADESEKDVGLNCRVLQHHGIEIENAPSVPTSTELEN